MYIAARYSRVLVWAVAIGIGLTTLVRGQPVPCSDNRPLEIGRVTIDRPQVPRYERVELTVPLTGTYDNPCSADEISCEATIRTPSGTTVVIPGFFYQPYELQEVDGREELRPVGSPDFRIRFTPLQPGRYQMVVSARNRADHAVSEALEFTAIDAAAGGFVRVPSSTSRYFALDNGTPFFCVGENLCWSSSRTPVKDYHEWITRLGAAGGNWARLWIEKGLEWTSAPTKKPGRGTFGGLGQYSQDNAWRVDQMVDMARGSGVRLMFCLGTYGDFTTGGYFDEGCWISNPYNAANDGPCATPADFWTNPEARRLYQQRLRYCVARWGYAPEVFAWEFWNEVPASPDVNAWTAEMAAYLKEIDPNQHLVSTTYGVPETWASPHIDFTMSHMYGQANIADFTPQIRAESREYRAFGKPYLLAEFGIDWQTGDAKWDPRRTGRNMHNGAWAAVTAGAAGTTMIWYWDSYVHPSDLYHVLTPVRRFADTVDWNREPFVPIEGVTVENSPDQPETFSDVWVPGTLMWGTAPSNEYRVRQDGVVEGTPVAMTIGSPQRGNPDELYTQLVWHVDMPHAGQVKLHIGEVCSAARLQILVDEAVVVDRSLTTGPAGEGSWKKSTRLEPWRVWVCDYDEEISVDVAAGAHRVVARNVEGDWLRITSVTFPAYRSSRFPDLHVLGLRSESLMLLWLHHAESNWRNDLDQKTPHAFEGLRVSLPAPAGSQWQVQWWDTWSGQVQRTEELAADAGGIVTLLPLPFASDVAVRAERNQ